jgi:hypothetical protein
MEEAAERLQQLMVSQPRDNNQSNRQLAVPASRQATPLRLKLSPRQQLVSVKLQHMIAPMEFAG